MRNNTKCEEMKKKKSETVPCDKQRTAL